MGGAAATPDLTARSRRDGDSGCPSRIRTSVHGSKVRCPTTRRRGSASSRAKKWSGRRDSNPRPSPWQGDALPTEPLPLECATTEWWCREPESNWRHRDFQSRALPTELSRPDGQPGFWPPVGDAKGTTRPDRPSNGTRRLPGHRRATLLPWYGNWRERRRASRPSFPCRGRCGDPCVQPPARRAGR